MRLTSDEIEYISRKIVKTLSAEGKLEMDSNARVVEAIGPRVADIAIGDHVVLTFDSCGTCLNCLDGHPAYCTTFWPRNRPPAICSI